MAPLSGPNAGAPARGSGRLRIVAGLGAVVVLAGAALALALVLRGQPGGGSQAAGGADDPSLPTPSLDADAPVFPVPPGSTLVNAQRGGPGTDATRVMAWTSPLSFDSTVSFYQGVADLRWKAQGSPQTTPAATELLFLDASGVFGGVTVEVDRTAPVQVLARFEGSSSAAAAVPTSGPITQFAPLPVASALPSGFPPQLVPAGATLVDVAGPAGTWFAVFSTSADVQSVGQAEASALDAWGARDVHLSNQGNGTVLDFTHGGRPGQVAIEASGSLTTVSIEVTP